MGKFADFKNLKPGKILLRAPNWLGDCIMAFPGMRKFSTVFPDAEISVAAKGALTELFNMQPWCSETITLEESPLASGKKMREGGFDMTVLYPNSFAAALEAKTSKITIRIGYSRDMRSLLLTHAVKYDIVIKNVHQVFYYLRLTDCVVKGESAPPVLDPDIPPKPCVVVPDNAVKETRGILKKEGIKKEYYAFAPGAAFGPAKQWPEEHFASLAQLIHKETGVPVVLVGGPSETEVCSKIAELADGSAVSLAGKTNLKQLAGVLSLASGYVGNDSGASHLAAAVGTPSVVLFGSTKMTHTVPLGNDVKTLNLHLSCAPCMKRECPLGHRNCLRDITPEMASGELGL